MNLVILTSEKSGQYPGGMSKYTHAIVNDENGNKIGDIDKFITGFKFVPATMTNKDSQWSKAFETIEECFKNGIHADIKYQMA